MPKTIHTPRDELVCGKLDLLEDRLRELGLVECLHLAGDIRHDCERMEAKLVERKNAAIPGELLTELTWCLRSGNVGPRSFELIEGLHRILVGGDTNETTATQGIDSTPVRALIL